MEISLDAYTACLYASSWVQCCHRAGLLRLDGCWLETTEYLEACFAGPVALEDLLWPLRHLVMAEAYEVCTLGGDRRRAWAVERLRELGLTDDGLVRVRVLVKMYARPVADALATCDGAVRGYAMHHDNGPDTLRIDFRGEQVAICYEIHRPGTESISFWFADGRPWPEDLRDEEVGAIREAIEEAIERG